MARQSSVTPEQIQQMKQLRDQGLSLRQIAKELGISRGIVDYQLRGYFGSCTPRRKVALEIELQMQELWCKGMSINQIAEEFDLSYPTVRRHIRAAKPEKLAARAALVDRIQQLYMEGKSYSQIEAQTGAYNSLIRESTKDLPSPRVANGGITIRQLERIQQLSAQGLSAGKVARLAGVCESTAQKYMQAAPKPAAPKKVPGALCRHKDTCQYWRYMSGLDCYACHYGVDNPVNRPWPADQCPGFPGPKTGPSPTPMGIKPRREKP